MIPMADHVLPLQVQYHEMMSRIEVISQRNRIPPAACLMLGFVGDQKINASAIKANRYYIGKNTSYNVNALIQMEFVIMDDDVQDSRKKTLMLTPDGLEVARQVREALARASAEIEADKS